MAFWKFTPKEFWFHNRNSLSCWAEQLSLGIRKLWDKLGIIHFQKPRIEKRLFPHVSFHNILAPKSSKTARLNNLKHYWQILDEFSWIKPGWIFLKSVRLMPRKFKFRKNTGWVFQDLPIRVNLENFSSNFNFLPSTGSFFDDIFIVVVTKSTW